MILNQTLILSEKGNLLDRSSNSATHEVHAHECNVEHGLMRYNALMVSTDQHLLFRGYRKTMPENSLVNIAQNDLELYTNVMKLSYQTVRSQ